MSRRRKSAPVVRLRGFFEPKHARAQAIHAGFTLRRAALPCPLAFSCGNSGFSSCYAPAPIRDSLECETPVRFRLRPRSTRGYAFHALLGLYIAALVFGGGLLALSVLGGGGHGDVDGDGDVDGHDLHADADADVDADHDHGHDHGHGHAVADGHGDVTGFFTIFASLRFWTFFLCFGGAAGLLLTLLSQPAVSTGIVAGVFGFFCGTVAAWTVRKLARGQLSSAMGAEDWVGRSATVVLPVSAVRNGKIRLDLDGEVKEILASTSAEDGEIAIGADVIVVEMDDGVAKVTPGKPRGLSPAAQSNKRETNA